MKADRRGYHEPPFFFAQKREGSRRFVAWFPERSDQRRLFFRLLGKMGERVEYLFKEDGYCEDRDRWIRVFGGIHHDRLRSLVKEYEKWFFEDSGFQFCFKEPDATGYVAYDEHGLFFIYDLDERVELLRLGAKQKKRELLMDKGHWHVRPADAVKTLAEFKHALKGASAFYEDEGEVDAETESPEMPPAPEMPRGLEAEPS